MFLIISVYKCMLPKETGKCVNPSKLYAFDFVSMQCGEFTFGGESGNLNQFNTLEECKDFCPKCPVNDCQHKCPYGYKINSTDACPTCECKSKLFIFVLLC